MVGITSVLYSGTSYSFYVAWYGRGAPCFAEPPQELRIFPTQEPNLRKMRSATRATIPWPR